MRNALFLACCASLLNLSACHKSDSGPSIDFGPGEGISYRDPTNTPTGTQDPTDWTADATWSDQEKALFSELSISLDGPARTNFFNLLTAYPNPAPQATFAVESRPVSGTAPAFNVAAVLVSRDYKEILRLPHPYAEKGAYSFTLDYAKLGLHPGERYRLYYVVYNSNGFVCKGHGDLRYDQ